MTLNNSNKKITEWVIVTRTHADPETVSTRIRAHKKQYISERRVDHSDIIRSDQFDARLFLAIRTVHVGLEVVDDLLTLELLRRGHVALLSS